MKILHLSGANSKSGAGVAVVLTHEALLKLGVESKILFLVEEEVINDNIFSYHSISFLHKLKRTIVTFLDKSPTILYRNKKKQIFSTGLFGLNLQSLKLFKWADIIHVHWANHGFINLSEINDWNKPIFWTLRDMWAFTGGCHMAFDCPKYIQNCGSCHILNSKKMNDLSKLVLNRKIKIFSKTHIYWVAISNWIKQRAEESVICKDETISLIHSGIDTTLFYNLSQIESRNYFSLPQNKKIILLGAADINEQYKGIDFITRLLKKLSPDYVIVTFGRGEINSKEFEQKIYNFGYFDSTFELNKLYNVADVFFAPSIAEAFGKTICEAQSSGIPVVSFKNTGPEDIIEHFKTGYLANYKDENDLLNGLNYCLNTNFNKTYIRERTIKLFDINIQANMYFELYKKSLAFPNQR